MSSTSLELIKDLEFIFARINQEYDQSRADMSRIDILEQEILHNIEFGVFNAVQGYKYAKKLKSIRTERREIKHNFRSLQVLYEYIMQNSDQILKIKTNLINRQQSYENSYRVTESTNVHHNNTDKPYVSLSLGLKDIS